MRRLFANIESVSDWCFKAGVAVATSVLFLMTLMITVTAVARKFDYVTGFAHEISGYGLVTIIFLGLAYTMKVGKHIEITVITSRLPPGSRRWLRVATSTIALAFLGWLFWFTLRYALRSLDLGSVSMTPLRVALWPIQMLLPIGLTLLALAILFDIVRTVRQQQEPEPDLTHQL